MPLLGLGIKDSCETHCSAYPKETGSSCPMTMVTRQPKSGQYTLPDCRLPSHAVTSTMYFFCVFPYCASFLHSAAVFIRIIAT